MLLERSGSGSIQKKLYGEGEIRVGGVDAGTYLYTRDHLSSVREVMKLDGTLQARYDYDAYGRRMTITQNANYLGGCDFGYTGHFTRTALVAERTELVLTHFRAYDPELGRWLSEGPIERVTGSIGETLPEGGNLYSYVGNRPVNGFDPKGLDMWCTSSGGAHTDVILSDPTAKHGLRLYTFAPRHGLGKGAGIWENLSTLGELRSSEPHRIPGGYLHIPKNKAQHAKALAKAQALQRTPPTYRALSENCSDVAQKILEAGLGVTIRGPEPTTPQSLNLALEFMVRNRKVYGF